MHTHTHFEFCALLQIKLNCGTREYLRATLPVSCTVSKQHWLITMRLSMLVPTSPFRDCLGNLMHAMFPQGWGIRSACEQHLLSLNSSLFL